MAPRKPTQGISFRAVLAAAVLTASLTVIGVASNGGTPAFAVGSGTVTGKVFNDRNVNGVIATTGNEVGVPDVTVKAYDSTGALVGTATTGADGTYTLTVAGAATNDLRIEFTGTARFVDSFVGKDNGTSIQFVTLGTAGAASVSWGVQVPGDYCAANNVDPLLIAARMSPNGYQQGKDQANGNCQNASVVMFPWYGHDVPRAEDDNYGRETNLLKTLDTGATYGLAYDKVQSLLWNSAVVRRHAGLGPNGVGGLYVTTSKGGLVKSFDLEAAPWNLELKNPSLDLSDSARGMNNDPTVDYSLDAYRYTRDTPGYAAVGKQGIGDIAIDSAYGYLYLTNLWQKKLHRVSITGSAADPELSDTGIKSWAMPSTCSDSTSDARPFGLFFNEENNRPWVGIVCTKERTPVPVLATNQATGLVESASIWELDPKTDTWAKVTDVNLNYPHRNEQCPSTVSFPYGTPSGDEAGSQWTCWGVMWHAWTDDWASIEERMKADGTFSSSGDGAARLAPLYAQPMLTGISRLGDGSIVVGITDRLNMQTGWGDLKPIPAGGSSLTDKEISLVDGDILLICKTGATYVQETNGGCTSSGSPHSRTYSAANRPWANVDKAGTNLEFFGDNIADFPVNHNDTDHLELSNGSIAVWPPDGAVTNQQVAFTAMDPANQYSTAGVRWASAATGEAVGGENLPVRAPGGFEKNANMGNLEIICDSAPVQIGNRVWRDLDDDGIQDPGELPIAGVTVHLYNAAGELVGTAITNATGNYYFNTTTEEPAEGDGNHVGGGLLVGQPFTIRFDNPADYAADGPLFTFGPTLSGGTAPNGANSPQVDSNLRMGGPGGYPYIDVAAPTSGAVQQGYDAGFKPVESVGSRVWVDADKDGIQDEGEPGFANAKVELFLADGTTPADGSDGLPAVTYTDGQGNYVFGGLEPGTYKIKFTLPNGVEFTTQTAPGSTSRNDSNADPATGWTDVFTLAASATGDTVDPTDPEYLLGVFSNPTIDAGVIVSPVAINGVVRWEKRGGGGIGDQNLDVDAPYDYDLGYAPKFPPVSGVIVELFDALGNPVRDAAGNIVEPTYTNGQGLYWFDNLLPGQYKVKFTAPDMGGDAWSPQHNTDVSDALDSNADPATGWTDVFDVLPYAGTSTVPNGGNTRTTTASDPVTAGFINDTIDALLNQSYRVRWVAMGSKVWFDDNKNGIQDPGEEPAEGVKVELLDPYGGPAYDYGWGKYYSDPWQIGETYTDSNGDYCFTELVPGRYTVRFTAPNGYAYTQQLVTGPGATVQNDSNPDPFTGVTPLFTINYRATGETVDKSDPTHVCPAEYTEDGSNWKNMFSNPTIDAGLVPVPVGFGNFTWIDLDGDGRQDPGEPPLAGVSVQLYDSADNPAVDIDGNLLPPVITDENGYYFFDNLRAGDNYYALFTPPAGYAPTGVNAGDDVGDSDAYSNGYTDYFNLSTLPGSGNMEVDDDPDTTAVFRDPTIDAGFVPIVAVGNYVWFDSNRDGVQGTKERGIPGIEVYLEYTNGNDVYDVDGNKVEFTTTDENGYYFFDNLRPGAYRVWFNVPAGYTVSPQFAAVGTDATDSNAYPSGPSEQYSANFTVNPVADGNTVADTDPSTAAILVDPTIDAGIYGPKVGFGNYVWIDADSDGIQDDGEQPLAGVRVYLTDPAGNPVYDYDGNIVPSVLTDLTGKYLFQNLVPGSYRAQFVLPAGYAFTSQYEGSDAGDDSNADLTTGITPVFSLAPGAPNTSVNSDGSIDADFFNPTIDAGVVPLVAIGNYVWIDADRDGVQEANEAPIQGVKVELYEPGGDPAKDADGNPVPAVYTNGYGYYFFDNLRPGDYQVRFTPPSGLVFTAPFVGDVALDSNAYSDGWSNIFSVGGQAGGDTVADTDPNTRALLVNPTIDAGVVPLVAIGDYVWYDIDKNGLQSSGEPPIAGVGVELLDAAGNPVLDAYGNTVAATTTDEFGKYLFDGLLPGIYRVRFTPPTGYTITLPLFGTNPTIDSNPSATPGPDYGLTPTFEVTAASVGTTYPDTDPATNAVYVNPTIDAGLYAVPVAVGDYVWYEINRDGVQNGGETPIAGVKVELLDPNGNPVRNINGTLVPPVFTNAQGKYFFDNLAPASYRIRFTAPVGYGFTRDFVGSNRSVDSNPDPYIGLTPTFSVTPSAAGETVTDTDPATKALFVDPTIDAGVVPLAAIGDYTWIDLDADGIQDASEPVLAGVKVELLNADGTVAKDADGNDVAALFTDANGKYLFDNLLPGTYKVRFTPPTGYTFTGDLAGSDEAIDSNPDPTTTVTPAFEVCPLCANTLADTDPATQARIVDPTIDAGFIPVMAVGNYVWFDRNANGVQDSTELPIAGVKVELFNADGTAAKDADGNSVAAVYTDADGKYLFDNLAAGSYYVKFTPASGYSFTTKQAGSDSAVDSNAFAAGGDLGETPVFTLCPICTDMVPDVDAGTKAAYVNPTIDAGLVGPPLAVGNYVWIDRNANGIQDNGEQPLDGVQVTLLDKNGNPVYHLDGTPVDPVYTDGAGKYVFDNLPAGDYTIRFSLPPGYAFTRQQVSDGIASNDSNPDLSGLTPVFHLEPNTSGDMVANSVPTINGDFINPTIDAGVVPVVAVGDYVWFDENEDGKQTLGEDPVSGATVELLNPDGTPAVDANGDPVAPVVTGADGYYFFDNLPGGTYRVKFTPPTGYGFTKQLVGSNKAVDSNPDTSTGVTPAFLVCPDCVGTEDDTDPATDAVYVNPTIDAGLVPVFAVGNYVWVDTDEDGIQDSNERGVAGVGVQLLDAEGNPATDSAGVLLPTVYTDEHGFYLFDNLAPGTYSVKFLPPPGYSFTTQTAGSDVGKDSNADTTTGESPQFDLCAPCTNMVANSDPTIRALSWNPTIDAGIIGPKVAVGDYVWQDANRNGLQEADEAPLANVGVELLDVDGNAVTHTDGTPVLPTTTDANGYYLFDNIPPGQYTVKFTLPNGYLFTQDSAPLSASDNDSDPDPTTGVTPVFTVGAAVGGDTVTAPGALIGDLINPTIDAGVVPRLAIGDYVWVDANRNGIQDEGEAPLPGTTVELYDAQGNPVLDDEGNEVGPVTTDANGFYVFDKLLPGNYTVRFIPPSGYVFTTANVGADRGVDSNPVADGWTASFQLCAPCDGVVSNTDPTITAARINRTVDAGVVPVVAVGDYTWYDTNKNGQQDTREPKAVGVRVQLYGADGLPAVDADGNTVPEIVTDSTGHYLFDNLLPGDYKIRFLAPWGVWFTEHKGKTSKDSNPDPETGWTAVFSIAPSASGDTTVDSDAATRARFVNKTIDAGFINPDLPVTGSDVGTLNRTAAVLSLLGLLLVALGCRRLRLRVR